MPPMYPPPMQGQAPVEPPKKKKGKKGLIVLGVIIGAVVLCSAIASTHTGNSNTGTTVTSSKSQSQSASQSSSNTGSQSQSQSSTTITPHAIGETVSVGDTWQITLSNARTDSGGAYSFLKSGDVYLVVDMSFKNISNREQELFGSADWTLRDTAGQSYTGSIDGNVPSEPSGKVEPGSNAKGTVSWEVPKDTKQFTLGFTNNVFESGQTIWNISVP